MAWIVNLARHEKDLGGRGNWIPMYAKKKRRKSETVSRFPPV